ncbi:MAG TPA: hypothetical protein VN025_19865 [Candidatus Dormibacteraeota bacterium]|jgi:hypothetical protein|nr:hypothetical protein [Candidatus Dormibacteraeota bacterium]
MKSILMLICGAFCVFGGIMHSVAGLPALHAELAKTSVSTQLALELSIFWVMASASVATFGGILLTCGWRMRKRDHSGSTYALWVATFLVLFNAAAMIWFGKFEPHFFAFAVVGILAAFAALPLKTAT